MQKRTFIFLFLIILLLIIFFAIFFVNKSINLNEFELLKKANSAERIVVAIVDGKEIYQETIDFLATGEEISIRNTPSSVSDSEAKVDKDEILQKQIRNAVVLAEAERLGLTVSLEEAEEYTKENHKLVKEIGGDTYKMILDYMDAMEMTEEEYVEICTEVNRNKMTRARLYEKFAKGKEGTYDEIVVEYEKYVDELIQKADIKYKN